MGRPGTTGNWQNFKWPGQRLDVFTRHEPFPSRELKATYIDKPGKRRKKSAAKDYYRALRNRWDQEV